MSIVSSAHCLHRPNLMLGQQSSAIVRYVMSGRETHRENGPYFRCSTRAPASLMFHFKLLQYMILPIPVLWMVQKHRPSHFLLMDISFWKYITDKVLRSPLSSCNLNSPEVCGTITQYYILTKYLFLSFSIMSCWQKHLQCCYFELKSFIYFNLSYLSSAYDWIM